MGQIKVWDVMSSKPAPRKSDSSSRYVVKVRSVRAPSDSMASLKRRYILSAWDWGVVREAFVRTENSRCSK